MGAEFCFDWCKLTITNCSSRHVSNYYADQNEKNVSKLSHFGQICSSGMSWTDFPVSSVFRLNRSQTCFSNNNSHIYFPRVAYLDLHKYYNCNQWSETETLGKLLTYTLWNWWNPSCEWTTHWLDTRALTGKKLLTSRASNINNCTELTAGRVDQLSQERTALDNYNNNIRTKQNTGTILHK